MTQHLHIRTHPFSASPGVVEVASGQTVRQMLMQATGGLQPAADVVVRIGGHPVPEVLWDRVRPKPGAMVLCYRQEPLHGGSTRQILGAVLMVALSVFTAGVASGAYLAGVSVFGLSGAALGAAIGILGSLAISALTKPPMPGAGASGTEGQWRQLTGSGNQVNPWGVIPFVVGESRLFPCHAALPYSEAVGEASYQFCLFDLGYGDLEVSDIRIGDTPIEDYDDLQYEITTTPTLYTTDVAETVVNSAIDYDDQGSPVERTTTSGVTSIALDLVYGGGLFGIGTSGKSFDMWVQWSIKYRAVGSGTWLNPPSPKLSNLRADGSYFTTRALNKKPFAAGIRWDVPAGQYEVQVTRVASLRGSSKNTYVDGCTWTTMRASKPVLPSTTGTNKLCMRIRATDQLNGSMQNLSCMVRQKIAVYDRDTDTWAAPAVNLNPAWVAYWLLTTCPAVKKHAAPARIELDSFADFAEFCDAHSFEVRGVCDAAQTLGEMVNDVLACSLGSLGMRDGRYTVVFDPGEATPTMVFTPQETANFKASRTFTRLPHALRVQFINPEADWQQDEIIVLDDGYSYRGVDARGEPSSDPEPEEFETLQLRYAADAIHAWRVGRYHFAQGKFRPTTYSWDSDIAGLGTVRGDCVQVPNDVTEWGTGWGVVQSITAGGVGGAAATVVLDQTIATDAGTSYRMQFRKADGSGTVVANLAYAGGETNVFALASLPAGVAAGDAAVLGETAVEVPTLLVSGVRFTADLGTQFTAVAYDARVAPYWADPPASIVSEITGNTFGVPDPPEIVGVVSSPANSDPSDAGIAAPVVHIAVREPSHRKTDLLEALL
ncbi:MAG: hypothetical protein J7507_12170 [Pseudoxanthomonas sp.]|nr:hypothetical protein [Pseudoxanthomonas sp.]